MAISEKNKVETVTPAAASEAEKKKKGFWPKFANFLMMGGFLIVLIVGVLIAVGISILVGGGK